MVEQVRSLSVIKLYSHPPSYEDFLRCSNGLEGFIDNNAYIRLWSAEDLIKNNQGYATAEFVPGLFLIGSDGGDEAFALDIREGSVTYGYFVSIPFIVMDWRDAHILGATFVDFINALTKALS